MALIKSINDNYQDWGNSRFLQPGRLKSIQQQVQEGIKGWLELVFHHCMWRKTGFSILFMNTFTMVFQHRFK